MKKYIFLTIMSLYSLHTPAQISAASSGEPHPGWTSNAFENKVFIENAGQFGEISTIKDKILFKAVTGGVNIFFTKRGLIYRYDEAPLHSAYDSEKETEGEDRDKKEMNIKNHMIEMQWVGSNPSPEIISENKVPFYYSYFFDPQKAKEGIKASAYKKIIYHNLYPNVDAEYLIPEDKGGIKYSLILHPGANLNEIKMKWSSNSIPKKVNENIIIKSSFGEFIDHAPESHYEVGNENIATSFFIRGDEISFSLQSYDTGKTIIIDPWISNPNFTLNRAYDVNYDLSGNVYAYGGTGSNFQLAKFNSTGALQWIYNLIGNPFGYQSFYGGFTVDGLTGSSYIGEGSNQSNPGARIVKINTSGIQSGLYAGNTYMTEIWRMDYNYCTGTILVGGGGTNGYNQAGILNTNLMTMSPVQIATGSSDVVSLAIDKYSNESYMMFSGPNMGNYLVKCPMPSLAPTTWNIFTGHAFVELSCTTYSGASNSFNGIAVSPNFVYTYDGSVIKKWDKSTGAFVSGLTVSATKKSWGGIDVDACDNLYVGVQNGINVYDASWTLLTTFPLTNTVYDLCISATKLYACGNGFVSELLLSPVVVCSSNQLILTTTPINSSCTTNGSATVTVTGGKGPYTYSWTPSGQTTAIATGLGAGTYTVSVWDNSCPQNIQTKTVTITNSGGLTLTNTVTNATCANTGTATVNANGGILPYTYLWSNSQTTQTVTGLSAGIYTVTVTDNSGCKSSQFINIPADIPSAYISASNSNVMCYGDKNGTATASATGGVLQYTYLWSNAQTNATAGGLSAGAYTVTVTDANGCSSTATTTIIQPPPVTINLTIQPTTCGNSNGSVSATTTGGTGSFVYSWNNWTNPYNSNSLNQSLAAGTYTLTVKDLNACTKTATAIIPPSTNTVTATFTYPATACVGSNVVFKNTGSTGTYNWFISPITPANVSGTTTDFSYTFLTAGTYNVSLSVAVGGCGNGVLQTITVSNCIGPAIIATGSSVCAGACASVISSGSNGSSPYTYSWSTGETTQNINPCPVSNTTYTVTITDSGGNTASTSALVTVNPAITVTTASTNITCSGASTGSASAIGSGGTSPYTFVWSNGQTSQTATGLAAGNYTLTIIDTKGCISTSTVTIISPTPLSGQFIKGTAACPGCGCKEWVMVNTTGGTGPYSYSWPDGYDKRYKNQLCPGAYTINVKDKNGCSLNVNITAP